MSAYSIPLKYQLSNKKSLHSIHGLCGANLSPYSPSGPEIASVLPIRLENVAICESNMIPLDTEYIVNSFSDVVDQNERLNTTKESHGMQITSSSNVANVFTPLRSAVILRVVRFLLPNFICRLLPTSASTTHRGH